MKKLKIFETLFFLSALFATLVFGQSAQAQANKGACVFNPEYLQQYVCIYQTGAYPAPGCSQNAAMPNSSLCPKVPAGYAAPEMQVTVTASPSSGKANEVSPTITWSAPSVASDPTSCTGTGVVTDGPAAGSVTKAILKNAGVASYSITCKNSSTSGTGSASVTVSAAAAPVVNTPTTPQATTDGILKYSPLEPLPGLTDTTIDFASMLNLLFKVLITVGALFAVGTLVWGGIMYMASGATGEIGEAKKRMQAAIYGLLLLAGSWLILNTINPQLLNFSLSLDPNATANQNLVPTSGSDSRPAREEKDACLKSGKVIRYEPGGGWECQ